MQRTYLYYFILVIIIFSCDSSNDNVAIPLDQQNTQDDIAIANFLKEYYFQSNTGKITKFDSSITTDDAYTPISDIAVKLPSGVWYAKNPEVTASGNAISSSFDKKLLISYRLHFFISSKADDETINIGSIFPSIGVDTSPYSTLSSGTAKWDNPFYFYTLTSTDINAKRTISYYEMEGLQEGLSYFKTTQRDLVDAPIFQGVIIVPSRLAYARDANYLNIYNGSIIFNFEILAEE